ncbi:SDR family NAD(P)-dependent oxidoreductase [Actinacidiphila sp. bgisy145]|uniref:SDR family NAD(P)-dependent oxidoreductase n=1 Tax=Actinacidiphila sp. bgisy145 TaxID=3413792 RepID=UPI003EC101BB
MSTSPHPVAIVTGAGRGVGAAVVRRLAARQFAVAAIDLKESWCVGTLDAMVEHRASVRAFGADLGFLHEAEAAVLRVVEALGPPSVVVNLPQHVRPAGQLRPLEEESDWDGVIRARLRAPLLLSRAAQRHLVDSGRGRIVNVVPPPSTRPPHVTELVSRAGLDAITLLLAEELGPFGVSAVTVAPAGHRPRREGGRAGEKQVDELVEELAAAVEFLVCDAEPDVTGRRLDPADCVGR